MTLSNHRPRPLRREFRRWLLVRRARKIRLERQFQELDEMLERIRTAEDAKPPWQRRDWGD